MTFPAIIFGIVLSTAYGTAFHFWKGGSLNKLFLYIILSWLGFWIGHAWVRRQMEFCRGWPDQYRDGHPRQCRFLVRGRMVEPGGNHDEKVIIS